MPTFEQALKQYQAGKRCGASDAQMLQMVYDEAIKGCFEHNMGRATLALQALSKSLDYSANAELAVHLDWIYHHCHMLVGHREFEHAAGILCEIRDALKEVSNGHLSKRHISNNNKLN